MSGKILFEVPDTANVFNVKNYGAVGDGVHDDTAAINAAIADAKLIGYGTIYYPYGVYLITSTIVVEIGNALATPGSGVALHFSDVQLINHVSNERAIIRAGASIEYMVEYVYNTSLSNIAPFYSTVHGIQFDGNGLAAIGLYLNYSMHMLVQKCTFLGLIQGIVHDGYGSHQILYNVFWCVTGIYVQFGGDHIIRGNDFHANTSGSSVCVDLGGYSGDTTVADNVFTAERDGTNTQTIYGVRLSGDYNAGEDVRDVRILNNEFCGMTYGVIGVGVSGNVYNAVIAFNHTIPYGTYTNVGLCSLSHCQDVMIAHNFTGSNKFAALTAVQLTAESCDKLMVVHNRCRNITQVFCNISNTTNSTFSHNAVNDAGTAGASYVAFCTLFNASTDNKFTHNWTVQSSTSYAQHGIYEQTGPSGNFATDNYFEGVASPYTATGAGTFFRRVEYAAAAPTGSGSSYSVGDIVYDTSGAHLLYRCTVAGAPGTFVAV